MPARCRHPLLSQGGSQLNGAQARGALAASVHGVIVCGSPRLIHYVTVGNPLALSHVPAAIRTLRRVTSTTLGLLMQDVVGLAWTLIARKPMLRAAEPKFL